MNGTTYFCRDCYFWVTKNTGYHRKLLDDRLIFRQEWMGIWDRLKKHG